MPAKEVDGTDMVKQGIRPPKVNSHIGHTQKGSRLCHAPMTLVITGAPDETHPWSTSIR